MPRPPTARGMRIALTAFTFLTLVPPPLPAIEIPGDTEPEYLARTFRPRWRMTPLIDVVRDLEHEIERPVQASEGTLAIEAPVLLVETSQRTVREILQVIERTHGIHCVAEPLRVVWMTREEERERRRRPVNLDLRDYGLFVGTSSLAPLVRISSLDEASDEGGNPFSFGDDEEELDVPTEFLWHLGPWLEEQEFDRDTRGSGGILLRLTPEEESRIRASLDAIAERRLRRSHWEIAIGALPSTSETTGGVLPSEMVRAVADSLIDRETFRISLPDGSHRHVESGRHQTRVTRHEVNQTGRVPIANPVITNATSGRSASLTVHRGVEHTLVKFAAHWATTSVEEETSTVRVPSIQAPPTSVVEVGGKKDAPRAEARTSPGTMVPGIEVDLARTLVEHFAPAGEVSLARGRGIVIVGRLAGRTVALCLREVTP